MGMAKADHDKVKCVPQGTDKLGVRQYLGIILKPHKMFQGSQTIVLVKLVCSALTKGM